MGSGRETLAGQVARLMLLACTLFGVVAMHSFGHLHGAHAPLAIAAHPHAPAPPAQVAGYDPMGSTDVASLAGFAAGSCPAQGCRHASAVERVAGGGGQHEGWNVCLAVLGSTGAALLPVLLPAIHLDRPRPGCWPRSSRVAARAPPAGLTLAQVSVMRI